MDNPTVQKPDFSYNLNSNKILQLINKARTEGCNCGAQKMDPVSPVTWNNLLADAAYNHSADMDKNNFFDHKGSDSKNVDYRLNQQGYKWSLVGENIARGQETEEEVVNSWLQSRGHCLNIMNKDFREMGVARAGVCWTQVFAHPLN